MVLRGRCYAREAVPYKAFDGVVDEICQFLLNLPQHEVASFLPIDIESLARVFPVLKRVEGVRKIRRRGHNEFDPVEVRRRAVIAMRELLQRIATERPLVLFIDDLQWGDVDSASFLVDLFEPPAPPVYFLATFRSEEMETSALLNVLFDPGSGIADGAYEQLNIPRLLVSDASKLTKLLLKDDDFPNDAVDAIARESKGSPYFIHEFVAYVNSGLGTVYNAVWSDMTLGDVVRNRISHLSESASQLLKIVSVSGKPVSIVCAIGAADVVEQQRAILAELREAHLIRMTGSRRDDRIEVFHDRIRRTVLDALEQEDIEGLHLQLALAIETSVKPDVDALAYHFASAGETQSAFEYACQAADSADATFAFDRAAQLHALAISLVPQEHTSIGKIWNRLADSLASAGRGADAGQAYFEASNYCKNKRELRTKAAGEFLRSGLIDEGLNVVSILLKDAGEKMAASPIRALFSLAWRRFLLRIRGLRFKERAQEDIPPPILARIDLFNSIAQGLAMVDTIRGADFQTRSLLLALDAGDPYRVLRALIMEAGFVSSQGNRGANRSTKIRSIAKKLVDTLGEIELGAFLLGMNAFYHFQQGQWRKSLRTADKARDQLRSECSGVAWELTSVQLNSLWALFYIGNNNEMKKRIRNLRKEAKALGDRYCLACLSTGLPSLVCLSDGNTHDAVLAAKDVMHEWSHGGYHLQHYWVFLTIVHCQMYDEDFQKAFATLRTEWPKIKHSLLLKVQAILVEAYFLKGRILLSSMIKTGPKPKRMRELSRILKKLRREKVASGDAWADILEGGMHCLPWRR